MALILKIDPANPESDLMAQAVKILQEGGVIAYPTETFYGLGVDAKNEKAIERLFAVKGRDFRNPIPIVVGDVADLDRVVMGIPDLGRELIDRFWPGPLTLIFGAASSIPERLTAGTGKIGIRISSHPIARLLAQKLSGPLTSTSANRSGQKECVTAQEVLEKIGDDLDCIIDSGETPGGKGSTILDITQTPPLVLRAGVIDYP
jgi:L-threonylcarbamoyladenylate synthase